MPLWPLWPSRHYGDCRQGTAGKVPRPCVYLVPTTTHVRKLPALMNSSQRRKAAPTFAPYINNNKLKQQHWLSLACTKGMLPKKNPPPTKMAHHSSAPATLYVANLRTMGGVHTRHF